MVNPRNVKIRGGRTASLAQIKTFAGAVKGSLLDIYLQELSRVCHIAGFDVAVLAAQSSEETSHWTSDVWEGFRNPAGMKQKTGNNYIHFSGGKNAARAHVVQMCAYVYGYLPAALKQYKELAPRFDIAVQLFGGAVDNLSHLGNGLWAEDSKYAVNIAEHLDKIWHTKAQPEPEPEPIPAEFSFIDLPTDNHFGRPFLPTRFFYHITDDLVLSNTLDWFHTDGSNASSNYVVDRDGTIYRINDPALYSPWTNGDVKNPRTDIPSLNRDIASGNNLNLFSVTIEAVGKPNVPPTDAQYKSIIAITKHDTARFKMNKNRSHRNRHGDVNTVDRLYCPGPDYNLRMVIQESGGNPDLMTD